MNVPQTEQYEYAEQFERMHRSARRGRKRDGRKRDRYVKECDGKQPYRTRAEGEIEQARAMERTGSDFTLYPCSFCGQYHIGHSFARKIPGLMTKP